MLSFPPFLQKVVDHLFSEMFKFSRVIHSIRNPSDQAQVNSFKRFQGPKLASSSPFIHFLRVNLTFFFCNFFFVVFPWSNKVNFFFKSSFVCFVYGGWPFKRPT